MFFRGVLCELSRKTLKDFLENREVRNDLRGHIQRVELVFYEKKDS